MTRTLEDQPDDLPEGPPLPPVPTGRARVLADDLARRVARDALKIAKTIGQITPYPGND